MSVTEFGLTLFCWLAFEASAKHRYIRMCSCHMSNQNFNNQATRLHYILHETAVKPETTVQGDVLTFVSVQTGFSLQDVGMF